VILVCRNRRGTRLSEREKAAESDCKIECRPPTNIIRERGAKRPQALSFRETESKQAIYALREPYIQTYT